MDQATVNRYRKTRSMAQRGGTAPERASAADILRSMEQKYPGIREAADRMDANEARPKAPPPFGGFSGMPRGNPSTWDWDGIFRAAEAAGDFVNQATRTYKKVATPTFDDLDDARVTAKVSPQGNMIFGVSIPMAAFERMLAQVESARGLIDETGADHVASAIARLVHDAVIETLIADVD
jgi:hypothetical protein